MNFRPPMEFAHPASVPRKVVAQFMHVGATYARCRRMQTCALLRWSGMCAISHQANGHASWIAPADTAPIQDARQTMRCLRRDLCTLRRAALVSHPGALQFSQGRSATATCSRASGVRYSGNQPDSSAPL